MPLFFDSIDELIEYMGEKVITAEGGPYIRVSDLEKANESLRKARADTREKEAAARVGTMEAAKQKALQDPEFRKLFEAKPVSAPAVVRDKNVAEEETQNVAAPAA